MQSINQKTGATHGERDSITFFKSEKKPENVRYFGLACDIKIVKNARYFELNTSD